MLQFQPQIEFKFSLTNIKEISVWVQIYFSLYSWIDGMLAHAQWCLVRSHCFVLYLLLFVKSFFESEQERITLYNYKHQQSHQLEDLRCNSTGTNLRRKSQISFFFFFFEVSLCPSTWNVKKWAQVTIANCWWLVKYARYRAWWVLKRLPVAEMFLFRDFQKNNMLVLERSNNEIWWIANWTCFSFTFTG